MDLIVRQGDQPLPVQVERDGPDWRVTVDGREYRVASVAVGANCHSLLIDGEQHELCVRRLSGERYSISTTTHSEEVAVLDPLTFLAQESRGGEGESGSNRVAALMAGRVVAVLRQEGEAVDKGQGVLVLEAMKMENEIAAERAGTVKQLFVEPGQAVDRGDPLFEIE